MSLADVQRAFARGLGGAGTCSNVTIALEQGGRRQRLACFVTSTTASAHLSESIPADMCPMQHARYMAQEFLEGRIAGASHFVTPAAPQPTLAPVVQYVPVQTMAPTAPKAEILPPLRAEPAHKPDDLDAKIASGDLAGVVDLLCGWIDTDAGAVRQVWTTTSAGQALEYDQVRREINDVAYGFVEPTPANCPCLWASVGIDVPKTGDDAADIRAAAALINHAVDGTNDFLARVRALRLKAKADVRAAGSIELALAVYQSIEWPAVV